MNQVTKAIWLLVRIPIYLMVAWMLGFGWFWSRLPDNTENADSADAIVVLTGDAGRIEAGLTLMREGKAKRMLISGVNPSVPVVDLSGNDPETTELFACCIDLGREAENTVGNARETAAWVAAHDFSRVAIITSDYHTPRSMVLLKRAMPDQTLIPVPVSTEPELYSLMTEYNKYLFTLARVSGGL